MALKIGTVIKGSAETTTYIERFQPLGIESVQIFFWNSIPEQCDREWISGIADYCKREGLLISALSLFIDPFSPNEETGRAEELWRRVVELATEAEVPLVSGFTGRVTGKPVDASFEPVKAFFTPVLDTCINNEIVLAFENCPMEGDRESGDWNIAFAPELWNVIFSELLVDSHCGLEFDPSHCFGLDQEPVALAETWADKIVHAHGKDSPSPPESGFCFPGEGMSDWSSLYSILNTQSRCSAIDLEGYHRKFDGHQQEVALQQRALQYLKNVRGSIENL
jgi:sugar phosphate isomerase/epimerase